MKPIEIEILGSAGAVPTPRALCPCPVCSEALEKGPPLLTVRPLLLHSRTKHPHRHP